MIRNKKEIEIFSQGEWIKVKAIISEELLCKNPECNRKPKGRSNHRYRPAFCSQTCFGNFRRLKNETL